MKTAICAWPTCGTRCRSDGRREYGESMGDGAAGDPGERGGDGPGDRGFPPAQPGIHEGLCSGAGGRLLYGGVLAAGVAGRAGGGGRWAELPVLPVPQGGAGDAVRLCGAVQHRPAGVPILLHGLSDGRALGGPGVYDRGGGACGAHRL